MQAMQLYRLMRYGSLLLISILLAKVGLSLAEISVYEWLLYLGTIATFFWLNGLLDALLATYPSLPTKDRPAFISSVFGQFAMIGLGLFVLLWLGQSILVPGLTGQETLPYYELYLGYLLFNWPASLLEYLYLLQKRSRSILNYALWSFGGQVVVMILPLLTTWGLAGSFTLLLVLAVVRFAVLLGWLWQNGEWRWRGDLMRSYNWLALPLMAYACLGGVAPLFDSWLVGWFFDDPGQFAIFRYGAKELPLAMALVGGIYTALVPEVSANLNQALPKLKQSTTRLFHLVFPPSIFLLLFSQYWYPWVFNEEFAASVPIFNIYLLLLISRVLLPYTILMGLRASKMILLFSICELLINVGLSIWWVNIWGLEGIAWATVVAFLFEKVAMAIYLRLKFRISIQQYTNLGLFSLYTVLLLVTYLISSNN